MKNIRRKIERYLRPTLGRDNDHCDAVFARVNGLQSRFLKLPAQLHTPAANSKQF
jgi:hypothetical protein